MTLNVKICGITRPEDAALAAELGATHLSCVMTAGTALSVTPSTAREIQLAAGKKIKVVLAFRAPALEAVLEATKAVGTRHVQITGLKEPELAPYERAGLALYRVHEVPTGANLLPPLTPEPTEKSPATLQVSATGAGLTFPWEILGNEAPHATFIGGAVRPENVCALLTHHPWGIAIGAGVEREPGVKDPDRMALFFETITGGG